MPRMTHYIPYKPHRRQHIALNINYPDLFFGGAGGGGKSDFLLMAFLQYADCSDYAGIIYRRTYPELKQPGGLIPRAMEWLENTDAVGAEKDAGYPTRWDFPSGAVLTFGHMQNVGDEQHAQGGEYQFVGVDELPTFLKQQYRYPHSRLRKKVGNNIPLRFRGTGNPGGVSHDEVKEDYSIPDEPLDLPVRNAAGRVFMPSRLIDNPTLDYDSYVHSLDQLDPVLRARILMGDWRVRENGDFFDRTWFEVIPEVRQGATSRVRFWDKAATEKKKGHHDPDWSVGTLMSRYSRDGQKQWQIEDVVRFRAEPGEVRRRIKQTGQMDGTSVPIVLEREPGASGKDAAHTERQYLEGFTVKSRSATGSKPVRAGPFATQAEDGNVKLVRGEWNSQWLDEIDAFPGGSHDDDVDSASGAFSELSGAMTWDDLYPSVAAGAEAA